MRRFIVLLSVGLAACGPSGVAVYDDDDIRAGEVVVESAELAIVYDRNESIVGRVRGNDIYDRNDLRVGRVRSDGSTIEDRDGIRVGRVRDGKRCVDRDDGTAGEIDEDIDDQAAGGACLLLLLR